MSTAYGENGDEDTVFRTGDGGPTGGREVAPGSDRPLRDDREPLGAGDDAVPVDVVHTTRVASRPGPMDSDPAPRPTPPPAPARQQVHETPPPAPVPDRAPAPEQRTSRLPNRQDVVAREKEQFGGVKVGSAFFGWLTATGTAVLLTALVSAAGGAVAVATNTSVAKGVAGATSNTGTVGLVAGIALAVVLFLAYFCGGYVAGRMARFNGARQGVAVWIWAVVIALVLAAVGAIAGNRYDVLGKLNVFPRIPVNEGSLTRAGVVTLIVLALVALLGAVLGGLTGMRFHRRVDRAGLGA